MIGPVTIYVPGGDLRHGRYVGRMTMLTRQLLGLALLLGGAACARVGGRVTGPASVPVVVVRHAERGTEPANDPVITPAGQARARVLDSVVRSLGITDVIVSDRQRTRLTAADVIARTRATVHVVPLGSGGVPAHITAVRDSVRAIVARGARGVLVVGHSNTVPLIVEAMGGAPQSAICDSEYNRLYTLRLTPGAAVTMQRSVYGAPAPADTACAAMR
jgi:phosphohistidine phosphatase SixA